MPDHIRNLVYTAKRRGRPVGRNESGNQAVLPASFFYPPLTVPSLVSFRRMIRSATHFNSLVGHSSRTFPAELPQVGIISQHRLFRK